jgi:hypothetical protein
MPERFLVARSCASRRCGTGVGAEARQEVDLGMQRQPDLIRDVIAVDYVISRTRRQ